MTGNARSNAVHAEYEKQFKRAHELIVRAFPEANRLARPDSSEMTFTLSGDPYEVLPDLKRKGSLDLKKMADL
jgi:hypothetical protein